MNAATDSSAVYASLIGCVGLAGAVGQIGVRA